MVTWYVRQIKMKRMTLDKVPKRWRGKVKAELGKDAEN